MNTPSDTTVDCSDRITIAPSEQKEEGESNPTFIANYNGTSFSYVDYTYYQSKFYTSLINESNPSKCFQPPKPYFYEEVWNTSVKLVKLRNCSLETPEFSKVEDGKLVIDKCEHGRPYYYIQRKTKKQGGPSFSEYKGPVEIPHEWIWGVCDYGEPFGVKHNLHAKPRVRPDTVKRANANLVQNKLSRDDLYDVLILMFDATSRSHFHRAMRKTIRFLGNETLHPDSEVFDFWRFNVVGENSPPNQKAMMYLNGDLRKREDHVFTRYSNTGYVTMNSVAYCKARCPVKDVDHSLLDTFFCQWGNDVTELFFHGDVSCMGQKHTHQLMLSYLKDFISEYEQQQIPFISWLDFMEGHENSQVRLTSVDVDFVQFLEELSNSGRLKRTFVILTADHGLHGYSLNKYVWGFLEHRNPLLKILAPKTFLEKYPTAKNNLIKNQDKVLTHYDLYRTLIDISVYPNSNNTAGKGISLFHPIPDRSCTEANIPGNYCSCLVSNRTMTP